MRYSLLDILACPVTGEDLVLLCPTEVDRPVPDVYLSPASRVSALGSIVGPISPTNYATAFFSNLSAHASDAADPARNAVKDIEEGILIAAGSGRWYPVQKGLPIMYPDSLRDWQLDLEFLRGYKDRIPSVIYDGLYLITNDDREAQSGDHHKNSEIVLLGKVEDPSAFLGPGYVAPFNWGDFEHSAALVRGFSICLPFMKIGRGDFVLDSGSGYSWTTEWLQKMGTYPVGIEINRTYLDVGRHRMGDQQPHLVVCDAENLPFKSDVFKAVLGFDAFHHIPNRNRAMQEFSRTMKHEARVVLVEPGSAHTDHPVSIEVSEKFGTMEVGMSLDDVKSYVDGISGFATPVENFIVTTLSEVSQTVQPDRSLIGWSLFTIDYQRQIN